MPEEIEQLLAKPIAQLSLGDIAKLITHYARQDSTLAAIRRFSEAAAALRLMKTGK